MLESRPFLAWYCTCISVGLIEWSYLVSFSSCTLFLPWCMNSTNCWMPFSRLNYFCDLYFLPHNTLFWIYINIHSQSHVPLLLFIHNTCCVSHFNHDRWLSLDLGSLPDSIYQPRERSHTILRLSLWSFQPYERAHIQSLWTNYNTNYT